MKTSARNQFQGTIATLEQGPVSTEVVIALAGGQRIAATLTTSAAQRMKLAVGQAAVALVKASSVVLVTELGGYTLSARNQLTGTIARVERGAVSSVVAIDLAGGESVTATITNDAADELALVAGGSATAVFKAYAVILAVASA